MDARRLVFPFLMTLVIGLSAGGAFAGDGRVEINQAAALAGGVTPGDDPGFPVSLSQPGSYVLTSDLQVQDPDSDGITIQANGVTLDLNGFALRGPITCGGFGSLVSCGAGKGCGVDGAGGERLTLLNGLITGFGLEGVLVGRSSNIHQIAVERNSFSGILAANDAVVTASRAFGNGDTGIAVGPGSVIQSSSSASNKLDGFSAADGSVVRGSTSRDNGAMGIVANAGCVVSSNSVRLNEQSGILAGPGTMVTDNAVSSNQLHGIEASTGASVQRNTAHSNQGFGLQIMGGGASYGANTIALNTMGTISGAGIDLGANACNGEPSCP